MSEASTSDRSLGDIERDDGSNINIQIQDKSSEINDELTLRIIGIIENIDELLDPVATRPVVANDESLEEFLRIEPIPKGIRIDIATKFDARDIREFFDENEQITVNITEVGRIPFGFIISRMLLIMCSELTF